MLFRNFERQAFKMRTTNPQCYIYRTFFPMATIYFVLYSSPPSPGFYIGGVVGLLLKTSQGKGNWQGRMWIKTSSAHGCFFCYLLRYCNKTRGWMGRGWGRREMDSKVWRWWKVPEVKIGLKRWSGGLALSTAHSRLFLTMQQSILCFLMSSCGPCGISVWLSSICCLPLMRDVLLFFLNTIYKFPFKSPSFHWINIGLHKEGASAAQIHTLIHIHRHTKEANYKSDKNSDINMSSEVKLFAC